MSGETVTSQGSNRIVLLRGVRSGAMPAPAGSPGDDRLDWLCDSIARNRFLPVPPDEKLFIGDGDFRAIGAEFLKHFVRIGGLAPAERVLEIGCGQGRMALPLTQFLTSGSYDGVDVVADGISWCRDTISAAYPAFRFQHLDVSNGLYNPDGAVSAAAATLPFADRSFDFILLTSVVTHLRTAEVMRYAAEMARLLADGGRIFLTLFLMDETAREACKAGKARYAFDPSVRGPEFLGDAAVPNAAVAYSQSFILDLFASQGLVPRRAPLYGHWSGGRESAHFQDILVLGREG